MKKIYLVEDDTYVSRMYERAFRFSGYEVEVVGDGEVALKQLTEMKNLPSAIVLDAMIPNMSGLDVLRNIKKDSRLKNIPVIILTNSFLEENAEQFISSGADLYLVKIENTQKDTVQKIHDLIENYKGQKK
jgi:DNA-binding response OmpR family regulator